jgi:hypothetical protein
MESTCSAYVQGSGVMFRDARCKLTGHFLFRTLGLSLVFSNTDKCNAHLLCSSRSPII